MEGRKDDHGKPRWDLLPWDEVEDVVKVLTKGAVKYEDDGRSALAHAADRVLFLMWHEKHGVKTVNVPSAWRPEDAVLLPSKTTTASTVSELDGMRCKDWGAYLKSHGWVKARRGKKKKSGERERRTYGSIYVGTTD